MNEYDPVLTIVNAVTAKGLKCRKQGGEFKAQCPSHEDAKASLQIGAGAKGAVMKCHAGCTNEQIMAALDMPMESMFADYGEKKETTTPLADHQSRPIVKGAEATYYYDDENGKVLFRVERRKGKQFVQARPDHVNLGEWTYTLGDARRVPFKLANLIGAIREGEPVFIVEGEKDVLTLEAEGIVATCNAGGAGKFKREYAEFFVGAHVVILPDNDAPGKEHAEQVASYLKEVARDVKIVELPVKAKGDVTDFLKTKGHNVTLLQQIVDVTEVSFSNRPNIFHAKELMEETFPDIVMAVPGIIAEGVTFLVGAPKIGKSWLSLGLGLDVAVGGMALNTIPVQQGVVLYAAMEDTPRRLQRRLKVMLGDIEPPEDLKFACNWPRMNAGGLDQLEEWLVNNPDARMCIFDTWAKVKGSSSETGSQYEADYAAVSAVKDLADQYGTAIVFIHHQRKAADGDPLNTVAGSTGLTGAADATVVLTRPRGMEEGHIFITGRDVEESRSIVSFDSETGRWTYLGEADAVEETRVEDQVINALANRLANGDPPVGPKELAEAMDIKEGTMKWLLAKLATEQKIDKVSRGKYTAKGGNPRGVSIMQGAGPAPVGSPLHVNTGTPPIPGMRGPLGPGGQVEITAEMEAEIDAILADDDEYGGLDDDE